MADIFQSEILRKDGFYVTVYIPGTAAAVSTNYTHFFTCYHPCEVLAISEVHSTAASSPITMDVRRSVSGSSPSSGSSLLVTAFQLDASANVPRFKTGQDLTHTLKDRRFKQGEKIGLVVSGTPTSCASVLVTVYLKHLNRGDYF